MNMMYLSLYLVLFVLLLIPLINSQPPTRSPTFTADSPTLIPTQSPTRRPTTEPTRVPTRIPTQWPTRTPTASPTVVPTRAPTASPTNPTLKPTVAPTSFPTSVPTVSCNAGSFITISSVNLNLECLQCEAGTMSTVSFATVCPPCAAGKFSNFETLSCENCPAGYFSSNEGTATCVPCLQGFYKDAADGSTSCTKCPAGRTTALTGSVSAADCQSPTTSFIFGTIGIFIAFFMLLNVIFSRFHVTSFLRRIRIVDPIALTCKSLMSKLDSIKRAMFIHKITFMEEEEAANLALTPHMRTLRNLGKMILMLTVTVLITMILMMLLCGSYVAHMFYQTFFLWRGLRFDYNLNADFLSIMRSVLDQIAAVIVVPFIKDILLVFYPFMYVLAKLSNIHLNLESVNVSCSGSQAPLEVLIDIVIVGLFTIYIETNYQVLITQPVQDIIQSSTEVVLFYESRKIMDWSLLRWIISLFYLALVRCVLRLKPMTGALQYLMSFVSVKAFFPNHAYSTACNNIANFVGIDAALAGVSTFLIYLLIMPVVYTVALVMVPGIPKVIRIPYFGTEVFNLRVFEKREHYYFANDVSSTIDDDNDIEKKNTCKNRSRKYWMKFYAFIKLLISPDVLFLFVIAWQNIHLLIHQAEQILGLESIIHGLEENATRYEHDKAVLEIIMKSQSLSPKNNGDSKLRNFSTFSTDSRQPNKLLNLSTLSRQPSKIGKSVSFSPTHTTVHGGGFFEVSNEDIDIEIDEHYNDKNDDDNNDDDDIDINNKHTIIDNNNNDDNKVVFMDNFENSNNHKNNNNNNDNNNNDNDSDDYNEISGKRIFIDYDNINNHEISIRSEDGFVRVNDDDDDHIFSYDKIARSLDRSYSKSWKPSVADPHSIEIAKQKVEEVLVLSSFCVDELKTSEQKRNATDSCPNYYTLSRWTLQELWNICNCDDIDTNTNSNSNSNTDGNNDTIFVSINSSQDYFSAVNEKWSSYEEEEDVVKDDDNQNSEKIIKVSNDDNDDNNNDDDSKIISASTKDSNVTNSCTTGSAIFWKKLKLWMTRLFVYIISFTTIGHLCTKTGRSAYILILWKAYIMMKVCLGIWEDDCMFAFDNDDTFSKMLVADADEKNMGDTLGAVIGIRAVLFQLVPSLTVVSIYVQNTCHAPIYVTTKKLFDQLPAFQLSYSEARDLAIEQELRRIGEHHDSVRKYKEYDIQEWVVFLLTLNILVTKSRWINYIVGALSVAMSISVVFATASSREYANNIIKSVVITLLVIYVPYSFFESLKFVVVFGKALHLYDSDFWFDFKSVWIWMRDSCFKSNTADLIRVTVAFLYVISHDTDNMSSRVNSKDSLIFQDLQLAIEIDDDHSDDDDDNNSGDDNIQNVNSTEACASDNWTYPEKLESFLRYDSFYESDRTFDEDDDCNDDNTFHDNDSLVDRLSKVNADDESSDVIVDIIADIVNDIIDANNDSCHKNGIENVENLYNQLDSVEDESATQLSDEIIDIVDSDTDEANESADDSIEDIEDIEDIEGIEEESASQQRDAILNIVALDNGNDNAAADHDCTGNEETDEINNDAKYLSMIDETDYKKDSYIDDIDSPTNDVEASSARNLYHNSTSSKRYGSISVDDIEEIDINDMSFSPHDIDSYEPVDDNDINPIVTDSISSNTIPEINPNHSSSKRYGSVNLDDIEEFNSFENAINNDTTALPSNNDHNDDIILKPRAFLNTKAENNLALKIDDYDDDNDSFAPIPIKTDDYDDDSLAPTPIKIDNAPPIERNSILNLWGGAVQVTEMVIQNTIQISENVITETIKRI